MIKAMILSAGLGTRLRPVTNKIPKPAIPFMGIPIALYSVEYALQAGAEEFVFNTHHLSEQLEACLIPHLNRLGLKYHFINESPNILGSGGGLKNAESLLKDADQIILCNADEIIFPENPFCFSEFMRKHTDSESIASLLCMKHPEAGGKFGGVWTDEDQYILGFGREKISEAKKVFHYTGFSVFKPEIFEYLPQAESNILYDGLISAFAEGHKACAMDDNLFWRETGNQKDFLNTHSEILEDWNPIKFSVMFQALDRFLADEHRELFLKNESPLEKLIEQSRNGSWNINLNDGIGSNELARFKNCIIAPSFDDDGLLHDSEICV
jgi:mannose-1-phosphate guanylyltransferase